MNIEPESEILYLINPRISSSIKSSDSLTIKGIGPAFELPLAFFRVLMVFAEKRTIRQALQILNTDIDIDIEELTSIVFDFAERDLLTFENLATEADGLGHLLNPRIFADPSAVERIGHWMRKGRAIIVPDALPIEFAAEVHQDLQQSGHWVASEGGHDFFHYRNCSMTHLRGLTPALTRCARLFSNITTRNFIRDLTDTDCAGETGVAASWYRPNDYALPHDDSSLNDPRSVAYIWYLTREWRPEWGGALFWCPTGQYILPQFNTLIMFKVTPTNIHWVCPVSPSATGRRLAINGFWNRSKRDAPLISGSPKSFISPRAYGLADPDESIVEPMIIL